MKKLLLLSFLVSLSYFNVFSQCEVNTSATAATVTCGEIIFESKDMNIGWDGTYNNLISKEGIYTYKITLKIHL